MQFTGRHAETGVRLLNNGWEGDRLYSEVTLQSLNESVSSAKPIDIEGVLPLAAVNIFHEMCCR